jgi:hypothetical protein
MMSILREGKRCPLGNIDRLIDLLSEAKAEGAKAVCIDVGPASFKDWPKDKDLPWADRVLVVQSQDKHGKSDGFVAVIEPENLAEENRKQKLAARRKRDRARRKQRS